MKVGASNQHFNGIVRKIIIKDFSKLDEVQWEGKNVPGRKDIKGITVLKVCVFSQQTRRVYWIKKWNKKNYNRAVIEASTLSKLQQVFSSNPRLFVPRLVIWDLNDKYVVTEDFGGRTLRSMLLWNSIIPVKHPLSQALGNELVDWLCCFQSHTNTNNNLKVDVEKLEHEFSWRLSFCYKHGLLSKPLIMNLNKSYKSCLASVQDTVFKMVPVHGDFGPVNVLIGRKGVCAIDFDQYHYGAAHVDVCEMWASLWAMSVYNVSGRIYLDRLVKRFVNKSLIKLNLDEQALHLGILQILLERMYFGVKGYFLEQGIIPNRIWWLARAFCYRHLLVRGIKEGLF